MFIWINKGYWILINCRLFWITLFWMLRWIHGARRSNVLERNSCSWGQGGRIAAIYDNWLRNQWSKGETGDGHLSETLAKLQAPEEYRIFRFSNVPAKYTNRDAKLGQLLDQSRSYQRESSSRYALKRYNS